ncbi:hypothetical protein EIN_282360 [Entamoeba invadens IP1]|uniref:Leucine rich repeat containing protein BspA family protein n=1 Tax=Entamoeba invadens IP1 TaxID=370355 RepID=A0A0A1TX33_ENTIV|nr:hypothetical protein EIN_282360 [Entamoeba invadens IP1]ELP85855.1 hypothetical protein EIN_282360 [Entamoeba invadens IP1]|eukprot:XP_004185201.1 hypothetical protein EIN_282360 [Entamoeba invadens IP1]
MDFSDITKIELNENGEITHIDLNTSLEQLDSYQLVLKSVTSLFIPSTVALVGNCCISHYNHLKNIVVPKYATAICNNAINFEYLTQIVSSKNTKQFNCNFIHCKFEVFEIPDGVKEIEENTFYDCQKLTKIVILSTVTKISENFVSNCNSLTEIKIVKSDNNITLLDTKKVILKNQILTGDLLKNIPDYVNTLYYVTCVPVDVTQIIIPSTITKIVNNAFFGINNLCELTLPDTLIDIGKHIFSDNKKLTKIHIGNNTKSDFDKFVVSYCCHLRLLNCGYHFDNIEFTDDDFDVVGNNFEMSEVHQFELETKTLENKIFENVPPLVAPYNNLLIKTKHLIIPKEVTEMAKYSCENSSIRSVEILNISVIEENAFSCCDFLTKVVFSQKLKNIKNEAFLSCYSLKEITLPKNIQTIGDSSFEKCYSLTKVFCENDDVIYGTKFFAFCVSLKEVPVIKNINVAMFFECKSLCQISLSQNCKEICDFEFYRCLSLSKIDIPKSVTRIGAFSFRKCVALKKIEIPSNVVNADDGAFYDCKNIEKVVIYNSSVICGVDVFEGCERITSLQIGTEKEIYKFEVSYTFYLQMKNIPIYCENVVVKRSDVLKYGTTTMINEIQSNNLIHRIDEGCFFNNTELTKIEIPEHVTEIGDFAFYNCLNLKKSCITNKRCGNFTLLETLKNMEYVVSTNVSG